MNVCIVGASGKLGRYMVQHALDRGYEVVGVCREQSVGKLDAFKGRITVVPGATNDREVIKHAVAGCDGVLTVLAPWGVHQYSSGTAQAVLDHARPGARLVFACGWHITRDGQDVYSWKVKSQGQRSPDRNTRDHGVDRGLQRPQSHVRSQIHGPDRETHVWYWKALESTRPRDRVGRGGGARG